MIVVLGLDLSLRATAGVAMPLDWPVGNWAAVRSMVVGRALPKDASEHERIDRLRFIADEIVTFAVQVGASSAWLESYAFSRGTQAHSLAELGGHVRVRLRDAGIDVHTAPMASARKLLLGKVPRSDVKVHVFTRLRAAGWNVATCDEADAFVAANWGRSELGGTALVMEAA